MRLLLIPVLATLTTTVLPAQANLRVAPSGRATTEVTLAYPEGQAPAGAGPMRIRIDYGQPHLRGRPLHTDSLVPYDRAWRTGANAATRLTTDVDLTIGGANIPKGTYVLYTLPSRGEWKLIIQRSGSQTAEYDAALNFATVPLRTNQVSAPLESFTVWLIPSAAPGAARGELRMQWGTSSVSTDWSVR